MIQFSTLLFRLLFLILGIEEGPNFPPPLTKSEERAAFAKMAEGDRTARDRIIEHNLRLVSHIIRKYYGSYPEPDELLSIGSLGLMKAVDTFRYDKGARFATYGARCVQNEILMFLRKNRKRKTEISFEDNLSYDADGNELHLEDVLGTEPDIVTKGLDDELNYNLLHEELKKLNNRDKEIIVLRYGLYGKDEMTQKDVAELLNISQSYISRIEKKIIKRLKGAIK